MKRILILMTVMTAMLTAQADDTTYSYLVFETADGTKTSVPVSSLTISISGNTLKAGAQTFDLNTLSKMYFSNEGAPAGIQSVTANQIGDEAEIYDLQGRRVNRSQTRQGTYIVKTQNGTFKVNMK